MTTIRRERTFAEMMLADTALKALYAGLILIGGLTLFNWIVNWNYSESTTWALRLLSVSGFVGFTFVFMFSILGFISWKLTGVMYTAVTILLGTIAAPSSMAGFNTSYVMAFHVGLMLIGFGPIFDWRFYRSSKLIAVVVVVIALSLALAWWLNLIVFYGPDALLIWTLSLGLGFIGMLLLSRHHA